MQIVKNVCFSFLSKINFVNIHRFFVIFFALIEKHFIFAPAIATGTLAQMVEQRTENPCVPGSIPGGTTIKTKPL